MCTVKLLIYIFMSKLYQWEDTTSHEWNKGWCYARISNGVKREKNAFVFNVEVDERLFKYSTNDLMQAYDDYNAIYNRVKDYIVKNEDLVLSPFDNLAVVSLGSRA